MDALTETEFRGLIELEAACDEMISFGKSGWVQTSQICGTDEERSSSNMRRLCDLGLAEGEKAGRNKQAQWVFRITPHGRDRLRSALQFATPTGCGPTGETE